uniref:Uncharacterized protein n=1 Tax=Megaselia scalaris TaxID=36166 RepID=T1H5D2_MEGSC
MALKLKTIFLICAICALAVYGEDTTTSTTPKTTSSSSSSSTSSSSSSTTTTTTSTSTTTTTSTTEAPISTTTKAPPLPAPKVGEWNSTCIKLKFAAQLSFSYNTTDNTTKKSAYNFPTEIITVGDFECNFNETESIILQWVPSNETKVVNSAKFTFYKDEKSYRLGMIHIKLEPKSIFPDANNDSVQLIYANNKTF